VVEFAGTGFASDFSVLLSFWQFPKLRGMRLSLGLFPCVAWLAVFTGCQSSTPGPASLTRIEEHDFGKMPDGTTVQQFTLRNAGGMAVKVMALGAMINELQAPDRHGVFTNVVLGTNSLDA